MKNKWNIKKCKWIVIATAIVLSFLIVFAYSRYVSRKMIKAEAGMTYELMKEEIVDYVEQYIAGENVAEYVSEEEAELISREISTRLVKAMPQESMPDEEREELHAFVLQTVQEQLAALNDGKEQVNETTVTQELLDYINNTVVPSMTEQLQLSGGKIDNLKTSLDAISTEYDSDKESYDARINTLKDRIDSMETHGTTNEELEKAKADLADLVNKRYGELEASTAEGLALVQTGLTEEAAARDAAINDAVSNAVSDMNTDITASVSALSDTLTADKAASEATDANLQNQIDVLSGSFAAGLGGVTISYQDGHFYATAEDGTSKKLDYAE